MNDSNTSTDVLRRVLVVDDEKQVVAAIEDLLEDDFEVVTATSAKKALKIVEDDPSFAVILSDQRMPGVSGDEFLARARELTFATRVLITGYADFDAVVRAINDGKVFAYVSKPWDPEGLKVTVHHAVEMFEATRALSEERSYMQALMNSSTESITIKDTDARYLRINPPAAKALGINDLSEAVGKTASEISGTWWKDRENHDRRVASTGKPILNLETRVISGDGTEIWTSTNKTPIRDELGGISGIVSITRNITEMKQKERQLELLYRMTEQVAIAGDIEDAIRGIIEAMAKSMEWDIGEWWFVDHESDSLTRYEANYLSSPKLMPMVQAKSTNVVKPGIGIPGRVFQSGECEWIDDVQADGIGFIRIEQARQCGIHTGFCLPVRGSKDDIIAVLAFFSRDLRPKSKYVIELFTAVAAQTGLALSRRFAEDRLRQAEELFSKIMDRTDQGVFVLRGLEMIYANQAFARMFGYDSVEEVLAQGTLLSFLHEDEHARLTEYSEARNAGRPAPTEFAVRGRRKDGTELFLENRVALVPWDGKQATCGNLVDVTEQRAIAAQLQQAQKMDALGQLTGGIAHDFNNLLTVINGNLELLARKTEDLDDAKLARWVNTARRAGRRGGDLTARLLAFSRRQVLEPTVLNLNNTVEDMRDMFTRTLGEAIRISVVTKATDDQVRVDPGQLESAILNLAINARDAMPEGGDLTIETADAELNAKYVAQHGEIEPGKYVMIAVTDTGTGMPPEVVTKVFEPFFTTKEQGKGTGLGLAMIYGFIKQSGGHITIYSEVGKGTTIRLYLPRYVEDGAENAVSDDETVASPLGDARILIVEDNEDVRDTAENLLDALGYDLAIAEDGPSAMKFLETDAQFDLLMTDIVMPGGMSGIELAHEVRKRWPDIKILYTSGYAEEALKKSNSSAVEGIWLAKPYTQRHLGEKVAEALGQGSQRKGGN